MHYVQVNKNYFQKVYANGTKKRISRNEYLEKTKQKGGNDQIKIEYDGKTYNYQMGATNNIKTGMAPKLKSDFVKNAKIKIGDKEFPLCDKESDGKCKSKGFFKLDTNSLISRKNKRDVNVYNNNFILKEVAKILNIPENSLASGGSMKGGEPLSESFGTVENVIVISAMMEGQNESTIQKKNFIDSKEQINEIKKFYNNEVKKNSYFKIGNFEQDGTIKSNNIDGKEYYMKVKFSSSDLGKTLVQIDEIVCINADEKNEMEIFNKDMGGILRKKILNICPEAKNLEDPTVWEKFKESTKNKFCNIVMKNAKKEFKKYQNNE